MKPKSLFNETGKFIFSQCGEYPALVCKGDKDFLKRCYCLIKNYGIVKTGKWHRFGDPDSIEQIRYVLAHEKDILRGLKEYFRWEVIQNYGDEIKYTYQLDPDEQITVSWDDDKVDKISETLAQKFWKENVSRENILMNRSSTKNYEEYRVDQITFQKLNIKLY